MNNISSLDQLNAGEYGRIFRLLSVGHLRRRYQDLGIIPGTLVKCVMKSPFGDPHAYLIRGAKIAIRNHDARNILITPAGGVDDGNG